MGYLDNLSKTPDWKLLGITESQANEIDMLDGIEDGKINGKSIFDVVKDAKKDYEASQSNTKKDSFFEYIKNICKKTQKIANIASSYVSSVRFIGFKTSTPEEIVEQLINEIYKLGGADLEEAISKINADNVVEILELYKTKSDEKNSILGITLDNESLFEAILDESIPKEDKKKYINHIKDKLIERINNMNGNSEFIAKTFDKVLEKVLASPWGLQDATKLNELFNQFLIIIEQLSSINKMNSKTKDVESTVSLQGIYDICVAYGIDTSDLFGNGSFDGNAYQTSGTCILHADINSMLVTEKGRQYINNLIVKNNEIGGNGNVTAFLPGAVKLGVPKDNPGYFTYSPTELINRSLSTSLGDGDYTALVCAIEDCRKLATGNENETAEGNTSDISIESLLFEQNSQEYYSPDNVNYEEIREKFDSGNYGITAGIGDGVLIKGVRDGKEIVLVDNHMYAVVAMSDTTVTLQESHKPDSLITVSKEEYIKMITAVNKIPDIRES